MRAPVPMPLPDARVGMLELRDRRSATAAQWLYRLKVRTEPSQGSNPGSSPGIATNQVYSQDLFKGFNRKGPIVGVESTAALNHEPRSAHSSRVSPIVQFSPSAIARQRRSKEAPAGC